MVLDRYQNHAVQVLRCHSILHREVLRPMIHDVALDRKSRAVRRKIRNRDHLHAVLLALPKQGCSTVGKSVVVLLQQGLLEVRRLEMGSCGSKDLLVELWGSCCLRCDRTMQAQLEEQSPYLSQREARAH